MWSVCKHEITTLKYPCTYPTVNKKANEPNTVQLWMKSDLHLCHSISVWACWEYIICHSITWLELHELLMRTWKLLRNCTEKVWYSVKRQRRLTDFWTSQNGHIGTNVSNVTINRYIYFYHCLYLLFLSFFLSMLSMFNFTPCLAPTVLLFLDP